MADSFPRLAYSAYMHGDGAHIRLKLDTDEPIALSDFVGSFVGLGSQFEKYVGRERPELRASSEFFVKEVRAGCVEADLVALFGVAGTIGTAGLFTGAVDAIDKAQILTQFVGDIQTRLSRYFRPGGREPTASKGDISDFTKAVAAIARDPKASATLEAATYEDGERKVRCAFRFTSENARQAEAELSEHRAELEKKTDADYQRVLLRFVRPSVELGKPGKKGGERGIIEAIHKKALSVIYASDLAEQRVRHELMSVDGNVFRKYFDVDVNVELSSGGKPIAYRITHLHDVVDGPDELDLGDD